MKGLAKKIELIANVAIILVVILLGTILVKEYLVRRNDKRTTVAAGSRLALPGVEWGKSEATLVLVLQKGCHFCAESAPFYERLIREFGNRNTLRLVAVLPQEGAEAKQYLRELGIHVDDVRQVSPAALGVSGTPTLILVDQAGVIRNVWVGRLPPDQETEVFNRLRGSNG